MTLQKEPIKYRVEELFLSKHFFSLPVSINYGFTFTIKDTTAFMLLIRLNLLNSWKSKNGNSYQTIFYKRYSKLTLNNFRNLLTTNLRKLRHISSKSKAKAAHSLKIALTYFFSMSQWLFLFFWLSKYFWNWQSSAKFQLYWDNMPLMHFC